MSDSDRDLWERACAGEPLAFGRLFERHATTVYNFCFRRTASWSRAEDLTSAVFLEAWEHRRRVRLEEDSSVRPWLLGVANNLLRNESRALRRRRQVLSELPPPAEVPDLAEEIIERAGDEEQMRLVLDVVGRLPRRQREVLALYAWTDLSYEETAVALNVPVGTVRSRLARARERLRDEPELTAKVRQRALAPTQATKKGVTL